MNLMRTAWERHKQTLSLCRRAAPGPTHAPHPRRRAGGGPPTTAGGAEAAFRRRHLGRSYRLPIAILAALAVAAIAGGWIYERFQPAAPHPQRAARQAAAPAAAPQAKAAPVEPPPIADIFAVRNWEPPPPPPPPSTSAPNGPPPPPEPPPLPFRYLGRIVESGKADAFLLAQGNRVIAVSVGNVIDGTYRVEKYENGQLYFLYRPMKARQVLAIGTMGNPS